MATNNFIVTSLPAYVQESRDLLLKNFALVGTATRRRGITLQTGVKKDAAPRKEMGVRVVDDCAEEHIQ